ncbi:MAG: molybdopterin oxidoreductase family protein [Hyphomicrobiales bacterium]|nr:molybdopterin oxidoreductase family protein [Hyphomicrobiales bacterium]
MNSTSNVMTGYSACPHDCPSTCALEVEIIDETRIGRVRGAKDNSYTDGVICAKVARYADRIHHPDRLLKPQKRTGSKGSGQWQDISWDDALDEVADRFVRAEAEFGSETVWPYFYAGTMGLIQRDSIERLRHAKRYSGFFSSVCVNPAWSGYSAGTGAIKGPDPREMAISDCIVIWGTNPVSTQVNVMTHAMQARKLRGAKIVAIDVYHNDTMKKADMALCLKPGSDGALACAVMHVLFRDGYADHEYLEKFADHPKQFEIHLQSRTPQWASSITGLSVRQIEEFARLVGQTKRSYFRLGYGFTRSRNGAINMHAASCIATITGAWQYHGGGAFHGNAEIYRFDKSLVEGTPLRDPSIRYLEQTRIGAVLCGEQDALFSGPPVTAMLVQNTNPASIAPNQTKVLQGLAREDLFLVVHEQFMTETAMLADIVFPATMFMEHDDIYRGGGHQYVILGPKLIDGPGLCRSNFFVIEELAKRLGIADQPGFGLGERQCVDQFITASNLGTFDQLKDEKWRDCQPSFRESHYLDGFDWPDGKFRLKADWHNVPWGRPPKGLGLQGDMRDIPTFPDYWDKTEKATGKYPLRLTTSPARSFLNSTFNETQASIDREGRPKVLVHPDDGKEFGIGEGDLVRLSNQRGEVTLHASVLECMQPGVMIAEGIWPNTAFIDGRGINTLTGDEQIAPHGGAAFHDIHVMIEKWLGSGDDIWHDNLPACQT